MKRPTSRLGDANGPKACGIGMYQSGSSPRAAGVERDRVVVEHLGGVGGQRQGRELSSEISIVIVSHAPNNTTKTWA